MSETVTTYRMYKFRLYRNDQQDKSLRDKLFVASLVWNHFIALQKRYNGLTGKHISLTAMNNHVLKLRKTKRYAKWKGLHSQACQRVALKRGKMVRTIGCWERTTGLCSECGQAQAMALRDRTFVCGHCGLVIDRDHNAAWNIKTIGASMVYRRDSKTQVKLRRRAEGRRPRL